MYLKKLVISSSEKIIREINFKIGTNLIVDETNVNEKKETGNNLGKTTVLALIDYCLGGDAEQIYKDSETKKTLIYIKDFLIDQKILVTLILKRDLLDSKSEEVIIQRNFLTRNKKIMKINDENLSKNNGKDFEAKLDSLIIGERDSEKPTFRQIIAHNIRYKDERINKTLQILNTFTSGIEYETLYLFMFGLPVSDRAALVRKLKVEEGFKKRLEKERTANELELQASIINNNIKKLETRKASININEEYEEDLQKLNEVKYKVSKISSHISEISLRKNLLLETEQELKKDEVKVDLKALKEIYDVAQKDVSNIQKTFERLVHYHNHMIIEKIKYITEDLPEIEREIKSYQRELEQELLVEKELTKKISNSDTFQDLENIIAELTNEYRKLGEVESNLSQIKITQSSINDLNDEIDNIADGRFTEEFKEQVQVQLKKFNDYFSFVSHELYGENYGIKFEIKEEKKTKQPYYHFESFNANTSSGKKQGEILCFDIAYILFARQEGLPTLDFVLNDKKELMHGNQLIQVNEFAIKNKIQLVFSILRDKVPSELNDTENIILRLSEKDKLFRIENS